MDPREEEELYFRVHGLLGIKMAAELNAMLEAEEARHQRMYSEQLGKEHDEGMTDKGSKGADRDR